MKHVGIVACSPPGAALCFEILSTEVSALANAAPGGLQVSMHAHALSDYMRAINSGAWNGVAELMLSSARRLQGLGAEFLIAPCNTIHRAFDLVLENSPLPWLHIAEEVARRAQTSGFTTVALLGTEFVTEGDIYEPWLDRYGIKIRIPERSDREWLNRAIFDEMVQGRFTDVTRRRTLDVLSKMKSDGCHAAGLCCTELPLLFKGIEAPLPLLDSTEILAEAALKVVSGERERPARWRGDREKERNS
jgi:aspartate racemase